MTKPKNSERACHRFGAPNASIKKLEHYDSTVIEEKRRLLLARLQLTHKTFQSCYWSLGEWPATLALLNQMVADQEIELVDGKYRPYGWKSPKQQEANLKTKWNTGRITTHGY